MRVCWKIGLHEIVLMQVLPEQIEIARRNAPNQLGVPHVWSRLPDGDFDWWPDTKMGYPIIYLDPMERARSSGRRL